MIPLNAGIYKSFSKAEEFLCLHIFFDHARMLLCLFIIIHSDQQDIPLIIRQASAVFLAFYLFQNSLRALIPLQFHSEIV